MNSSNELRKAVFAGKGFDALFARRKAAHVDACGHQ
jgi:hypothetical protein